MIAAFPLMLVPLALYNLAMIGLMGEGGAAALDKVVLSLSMLSGAVWTMSLGDLMIVIGLVALFFEIVKATRTGSGSLINHMLSLVVFILFLVEFLLVQGAATQIFFIYDHRLPRRDRRLRHLDPYGRTRRVHRIVGSTSRTVRSDFPPGIAS